MTTDATWFGEVRALAQRPHDAKTWSALLSLALQALADAGAAAFADIHLPYLTHIADSWPAELRTPPADWHTWRMADHQWAIVGLARAVHLDDRLAIHTRSEERRAALLGRLDAITHLHISHEATAAALRRADLPAAVHHLTLTISPPDALLQSLGAPEWLAQITHLRLLRSWGSPDPIPETLRLPALRWLEAPATMLPGALDLGPFTDLTLTADLTGAALTALLDHPRARTLTALRLERPNCDRPILEALVSAPALGALERLDLQTMPLWEQAADGLGRHMRLPSLRHLGLHTCHLGDEELLALLGHGTLAVLDVLDLRGNRLGADGVALVREALPDTRVELEGNWIEDATRGAPATLALSGNRIPTDGIAQIARIIQPRHLTQLTLRRLQLADRDLTPLTALLLPAMTHLDLGENVLRAGRVAALLAHDRWPALAHLDLSQNPLGDELTDLLDAARARRLGALILRGCMLSERQLVQLHAALKAGWRPELLDLSQNPIPPDLLTLLRKTSPDTTLRADATFASAIEDMIARGDHTLALDHALLAQLSQHADLHDAGQWAQVHSLRLIESAAHALWPSHLLYALRGPAHRPCAHLRNVTDLTIQGHVRVNDAESYQLAEALPARLQTLRMTSGALTSRAATTLLTLLTLPELTTLDLRHNNLASADTLRALARDADLPALRLIQLREGNTFEPDDLRALERSLPHTTVI